MSVKYNVCEYKRVKNCSVKCDVYPGSAEAPVAVYIHGGALIFGGRGGIPDAVLEPVLKAGYWVASIDYRLAPETKLPEIIGDVRDALDWIRGEGRERFGYDAGRMAVMGGSAGGYLTLMTGTFDKKPKALVSLYGYGDLLGDWYCKPSPHYCEHPLVPQEDALKLINLYELSEVDNFNRFNIYLWSRQTGTWTGLVSGYDVQSEKEKIEKYCPILNISDDYPPTILLHGDKDTDVPYEQSLDMYNALKARGRVAELVTYAGGGHGFDNNQSDQNIPGIIDRALAFMGAHV